MPIFYEHIKGCHKNTTSTDSGNWSWIEWQQNANPKIYLATNATKSGDRGNIITSGANNQSITEDFLFTKKIYFNSTRRSYLYDDGNIFWWYFNSNCYITSNNRAISFNAINGISFNSNTQLTTNGNLWAKKGLYVGTKETNYPVGNGVIKADDKCEALYFNAVSDRRAKTNIEPLKTSALSVIKSLPIYTFNYINKPEELSIGLIAQEAAEHFLDDFNMVDNIDASGRGYDLMQMKESKLVYVLWKAVQELSAEVESLKEQLNSK